MSNLSQKTIVNVGETYPHETLPFMTFITVAERENERHGSYFGVELPRLEEIAKYLGKGSIDGLAGVDLLAPEGYDTLDAFDYFYHYCRTNGEYKIPEDETLYRKAAEMLAKLENPSFEDFDRKSVKDSFDRLFGFGSASWWNGLSEDEQKQHRNELNMLYRKGDSPATETTYGSDTAISHLSELIGEYSNGGMALSRILDLEQYPHIPLYRGPAMYLALDGAPEGTAVTLSPTPRLVLSPSDTRRKEES